MKNRHKNPIKGIGYLFSQALRLYSRQRLYVILLLFCYTVSFSLPVIAQAYRDTELAGSGYLESDVVFDLQFAEDEQRERLTTHEALAALMAEIGLPEGSTVNIFIPRSNASVVFKNQPVQRSVFQTLVVNEEEGFHRILPDEHILLGTNLQGEYSCIVGENTLPGARVDELIGKQVLINTIPYTIVGVSSKISGIIISPDEMPLFFYIYLYMNIPGYTKQAVNRLADALEERGFLVARISYTEAMRKSESERIMESTSFHLLFAFASYLFCIVSTIGVMNAAIYDNKQRIYVKMAVGASVSKIALEYFLFFFGLAVVGMGLAIGFLHLTGPYFVLIGFRRLSLSPRAALTLLALGMFTSLFAATYAARFVSRKIL